MPVLTRRYDLLCSRLDRFTRMLPGVDKGDVRAVHQARVASRRLRELVPILQLEQASAHKLGRRLRRVTRRFGTLRELDVLLELTAELQKSQLHSERALRRVSAEVQTERADAFRKVSGKRGASELRRITRKLEKIGRELEDSDQRRAGTSAGRTARTWQWAIDARVSRRTAAVERAIEEAGALYLQERLHAVRIAVKKLRYGLELAVEASGAPTNTDLEALKRGQTLLGRMHDLEVLIGRVRRVQATLGTHEEALRRELDEFVIALDKSCRRLHARYVSQRATLLDICRRLAVRAAPAARVSAIRRAS